MIIWGAIGPTGVPRGFSFRQYDREGTGGRFGALHTLPNALLVDPNYGPMRLRDMLTAFTATAAHSIHAFASIALALQPLQSYRDLTARRGEQFTAFHHFAYGLPSFYNAGAAI